MWQVTNSHVIKRKGYEFSQNKKKVTDSHITKMTSYEFSHNEKERFHIQT